MIIVGHGESLIGDGRGAWIDAQDFVCHVNRSLRQEDEQDSGSRSDAIAGQYHLTGLFAHYDFSEFWAVGLNAVRIAETPEIKSRLKKYEEPLGDTPLFCPGEAMLQWAKVYRRRRKEECAKLFSNGLGAIICACVKGFKDINLLGFDCVEAGRLTTDFHRIVKIKHDWEVESRMVGEMAEYYDTNIWFN